MKLLLVLQVNYSDVEGGRHQNVQNDADWNQDGSEFDSDFSHSGGTVHIYPIYIDVHIQLI